MLALLTAEDGSAFREIVGHDDVPLLCVCDHASNRIPAQLYDLGGLSPADRDRHIAWDRGAARVTEIIVEKLKCSAILTQFSRLVVDVNRQPHDPEFIVESSDGTSIPANIHLSVLDKAARYDQIFRPYQDAIHRAIERLEKTNREVTVLALHSFTPQMKSTGEKRPWNIGVLWRRDKITSARLIDYLRGIPGIVVGDNEPYSMLTAEGYTLEHHAEGKRPSVLIEIRQDLLEDEKGCQKYADLISHFFLKSE